MCNVLESTDIVVGDIGGRTKIDPILRYKV